MKKFKILCAVMVMSLIYANTAFSGTQAGMSELGAQITFQNVSVGDDSTQALILSGRYGYFVSDQVQLALSFAGQRTEYEDFTSTNIFVEFEPNYMFRSEADNIPYIGAHVGMIIYENDFDDGSTLTYGAQLGIKSFISENTAIDYQVRYTTYEPDDFDESIDVLQFRIGVNIYW